MAVRAVVFDIGGILEITPDTGWRAKWEARFHWGEGALDQRLMPLWRAGSVGAMPISEIEARMAEVLGLDDEQLGEWMTDLWNDYLGELNVELAEYFGSLRSRVRTGIISNSFVGAREKEHERYGFGDLCDPIIYSHEVGMEKPDPRIFLLACERLGVRPDEVVFLDDVPMHVDAACKLGMTGILYRDNAQAIRAIEACLTGAGRSEP